MTFLQVWYLLLVLVLLLVGGGRIQVLIVDLELCLYCGNHPKFSQKSGTDRRIGVGIGESKPGGGGIAENGSPMDPSVTTFTLKSLLALPNFSLASDAWVRSSFPIIIWKYNRMKLYN